MLWMKPRESSLVSDFVVASFVPTHFSFDLSCHSYHLILLLRIGKPSDPLKGDAHVDYTLSSLKLSDLRRLAPTCSCSSH